MPDLHNNQHRAIRRATLAVAISMSLNVHANTITVTGISPSDCTLVKAITTANDGSTQSPCTKGNAAGPDLILLQRNLAFSSAVDSTDGANALPSVTSVITVDGQNHEIKRASSTENFRLFHVGSGGDLTLKNVTVTRGKMVDPTTDFTKAGGAVLVRGKLTLDNATLSYNSATYGGAAGLYHASAVVKNSTISSNYATQGGGMFFESGNATIDNSTISDNSAQDGAGLAANESANVTVTTSTLIYNTASLTGGAIYAYGSSLTLSKSAVVGNEALVGGGLYCLAGPLTVSNSTLSGNAAGEEGGAIAAGAHVVKLLNDTIANNSAPPAHAGGLVIPGGTLTVGNTLLANNAGGDCYPHMGATVNDLGHNWESDNTCSGHVDGDPKIGPLADNGGPTLTHASLPGSGVIDAGDDAICAAAPVSGVDQRGETRLKGAHCDIGAYENPRPRFNFAPVYFLLLGDD